MRSRERGGGFLYPLHREGEGEIGFARRDRQALQQFQQRRADIAAPAGVLVAGVDHVPTLQRRDRHDRRGGQAGVGRKGFQRAADVLVGQRRVAHRVQLVDGKQHRRHPQQLQQQAVAARLRQQLQAGVGPVQLGRVDQHHGGIGLRRGGDHVARVLLVARRVADDELARFGAEVAVGHVDGDALLALRLQPVRQLRQVRLAPARHPRQVVLQHGFAVDQQATDERALAIIHAAAGDEAQGGFNVFCACGPRGVCVASYQFCSCHHFPRFWWSCRRCLSASLDLCMATFIGYFFIVLAVLVAALNWTAILSSRKLKREGSQRHVSTVPLVVQIFAALSYLVLPQDSMATWLRWAVVIADPSWYFLLSSPITHLANKFRSKR